MTRAKTLSIVDAIEDDQLFGSFFGDSLASWRPWLAALKLMYGLPTSKAERKLIRECTGRKKVKHLTGGFQSALFLVGRRGGKSRMAAIVGAFEAALSGREKRLAKGEVGVVVICAPSKAQGRIVKSYLRALFETPLLANEVVAEHKTGFQLRNGVLVEIMAGDYRLVRGYSVLAAICDEIAFMGTADADGAGAVKSDTALMQAIKPALATTKGRLLAISTPYAKKGWTYSTWKRHWGREDAKTLCWVAPSRRMNCTLDQSVVDEAMAEDMQAAKSEFLAEFRDDVGAYVPRALVEALVVPGRQELPPNGRLQYAAFVDLSGGRHDDAAMAITHRDGRKVILDLARRWKAPFAPYAVIREMVRILAHYEIVGVTGDAYAAEFCASAFRALDVRYEKSALPKSGLYLELLPRLSSNEVELLDVPVLVDQLSGLERRTRSGGADKVDHAPGAKDDLANAVAGAVVASVAHRTRIGAVAHSEDNRAALARLVEPRERIGKPYGA